MVLSVIPYDVVSSHRRAVGLVPCGGECCVVSLCGVVFTRLMQHRLVS